MTDQRWTLTKKGNRAVALREKLGIEVAQANPILDAIESADAAWQAAEAAEVREDGR